MSSKDSRHGSSSAHPLHGKKFYLNLIGYRHVCKLTEDIKKLGGSVEEFLSNDVKYLVTNRADWKNFSRQASVSPLNNSTDMSPSPFQSTVSSVIGIDSPLTDSSVNECNKVKSRGKAIVEKSKVNPATKGTCDVLKIAERFGTKILSLENVLKWIGKWKHLKVSSKSCAKCSNGIRRHSSGIFKFRSNFLKFESYSRWTRPVYKELKLWPTLCYDNVSTVSPFYNKIPTIGKNSSSSESNSFDKHSRKKKLALTKKKKRLHYCEICSVQYDDVEQHQLESRHREFASDAENFRILDDYVRNHLDAKEFDIPSENKVEDPSNSIVSRESEAQGGANSEESRRRSSSPERKDSVKAADFVRDSSTEESGENANNGKDSVGEATSQHRPSDSTGCHKESESFRIEVQSRLNDNLVSR